MSKLIIEGKHELKGEVKIGGAKNSAVALIPTAILSDGITKIHNVPNISDIKYLIEILNILNCKVKKQEDTIIIDSTNIKNAPIPNELTTKLRASYYFMGALLARFKKVEISYPGGCKIGARPIDIHLFGFRKLGATITQKDDVYIIEANELVGNKIYLDFASIGATINIMLAATKSANTTIIENAAKEPEIVNVASFLINMGVEVKGAGTNKIVIKGTENIKDGVVEVFPDRIETATYMIIGFLTGQLKITNCIPEHNNAFLIKLREMRINYKVDRDTISVRKQSAFKPAKIKTLTYPGFPTDIQQPISALLTQSKGESIINETIYENRFLHSPELNKLGANTYIKNKKLYIIGPTHLKASEVTATDLRCGACLLIAALIAEGKTTINDAQHILRGYENIVEKLQKVGAKIKLVE